MSGSQQLLLGGSVQQAVDPYFYSVTSLLHGDGTNGGQNNTFLDSSSNNFTITRNGNTTQGSFSPFSQTGWSNYFSSTGSYLSIADNTDFALSGDFTIETWIYLTSQTLYPRIFSFGTYNAANSFGLEINSDSGNTRRLYSWYNGTSYALSANNVIPLNAWTHIAVVRSGTTITCYVNGTSTGTITGASATIDRAQPFYIAQLHGFESSADAQYVGYISNFSMLKGTAKYTSNFTPSTTPLAVNATNQVLLTCAANRFVDSNTSTTAKTITVFGSSSVQPFSPFNPTTAYSTSAIGGSGYFDGSGDYLSVPSNAAFGFGTGDFTIECWVNPSTQGGHGSSNNDCLLDFRPGSNGAYGTLYIFNSGAGVYWFVDSANRITGGAIPNNSWSHIVVSRVSGNTRLFINGVQSGSTYVDSTNYATTTVWAAQFNDGTGSGFFNGYFSDIRIVKGSGVTSVTVPTSPLTAIANTSLLLNFTNGAIFDNAAVADYETVGNAQISTSVKKYGTGSMSFDGTGDYLVTAAKPTMTLGTGDFTVEFWMYANTPQPSTRTPLLSFGNGFTTNVWDIQLNNTSPSITNQINVWAYNLNSAAVWLQGGPTIAASTWYHIALCRNGSTFKLFVNGTQAATATSTSSIDGNSTTLQWQVAYNSPDYFNGYIDDIRITKGVARYNYNFTPPTAEFPNIGGTVTLTADPYFDYTTLLLPGNGTNGAQNNTFLDSSTNAFTITRNGNTTQGTFSPFSQTGWGNYFNGTSGEFLNTVANTAFNFGTGDFTVEAWVYPTGTLSVPMPIIEIRTTGGATGFAFVRTASAQTLNVYTNSAFVGASTISLVLNSWNHVALTRSGNTWSYWINGTSAGSFTNSSTQSDGGTTGPKIGGSTSVGEVWIGYISNARITKGGALYTSNFTPSTTPLTTTVSAGTVSLLTCQSNRFLDSSSNAFAITRNGNVSVQAFSPFNPTASWSAATYGGSGYFDGSGDYLTLNGGTPLTFGTGDFTIEFWYYSNNSGVQQILYDGRPAGTNGIYVTIFKSSGNVLELFVNNAVVISGATAVNATSWNHVALSRSGTSTKLFLNGVQQGSTYTDSNNYLNGTSRPAIGSDGATIGNLPLNGYLSDLRVLKGTALYTAAFTPPTAPLTAITNTQLLLNYTNGGIVDATSKNDLETVGNAQISTTQSKFGGSSMSFDGNGDNLLGSSSPNLNLTTGDWTMEAWVYLNSLSASQTIVCVHGGSFGINWWINTSGQLVVDDGANPQSAFTGASISVNTWTHVALTRYGTTTRGFVNGLLAGSNTFTPQTCSILLVGRFTSGTTPQWFNGYIDDLRITKGIARYTSNFTPPTTAFLTL